eukprot:PITA_03653
MVTRSPNYVWEQKLKATKAALKEWVKTPPNTFNTYRKEAVQQLADLQLEMEGKDITMQQLEKEQVAQLTSFSSFRKEEEIWRFKSRSLWLKAGDRNIAFFHKQFRACLSRNHISEITSADGIVTKGFAQVKEDVETHFQRLYIEDGMRDEAISNDFLSQIASLVNEDNSSNLMKPFTEEEISNAIWDMEPDKAPGPDGFSAHFYRAYWTIIKSDLLRMAKAFQKKTKVGGSTKSTFLALIPKEVNPATFDRFRPISLCNVSYKILAKLLANRIKTLLSKLISPDQGGFVAGRHILDSVILFQESVHSSCQRKEKGMLIKLDMTNTFDQTEAINNIKTKIASWGGKWLNYAGKLILIKFVLSSLPIYQASFLLAPKTIKDHISQLLRDFLWKGGKGNERKFHLVSWDIVKRPKLEGGLQIRDPNLANIALGGKILWQLYSNKHHPVSQLLQNKDFKGASLRNLQADNVPKGTLLWNLCRTGLATFQNQLYKVPGNGANITIWQDKIMGNSPL